MKISGVYEIVNTITGEYYIGSTVDLEKRIKHPVLEAKKYLIGE